MPDLLKERGGRIDVFKVHDSPLDADARVDQAIAESFPASDAPSWNAGVEITEPPAPRAD